MQIDTAVVGGGIGGLAFAFYARKFGGSLSVIDPHVGLGASDVAAGMLAPASEVTFNEDHMAHLLLDAAAMWPEFITSLARTTYEDLGFEQRGTLLVGFSDGDFKDLIRLQEYQKTLGINSNLLTRTEARSLEGALSPKITGALHTPNDHQVDNRKVVAALKDSLVHSGVNFISSQITEVKKAKDGFELHCTDDDTPILAKCVVLATGYSLEPPRGSDSLGEELKEIYSQMRPVRGDIIRLRSSKWADPPSLSVRSQIGGRWSYVVARKSGEIVIGATSEETTYPQRPKAGSVLELLQDALMIIPSLREAEIIQLSTGIRPGTTDNFPLVGATSGAGLYVLNGLYRHGFLLAPILGSYLSKLIFGENDLTRHTKILDPLRGVGNGN